MLLQKAQNQEIVVFNYFLKMLFFIKDWQIIHNLMGSYLILIFFLENHG
jgi:hypothetical protein